MNNENLIKGGYSEEIRDEYKVSEKLKRIWGVELGLYKAFADLCDRHGLRYFVAFGSLLGAIRHNGFIPWDDDFDVIMPREDYEKFLIYAQKELSEPYFLQTPYTDTESLYSFAKLRDSNTSWIPPFFRPLKMNHGIWLDIFPLDYCDFSTAEIIKDKIFEHIMKCMSHMKRYSVDMLDERQLSNYNKYQTNNPLSEYDAIQTLAKNIDAKDSGYLGVSVITVYPYTKMIWPSDCFDDYELVNFENIQVRVPKGFDKVLSTTYGSYMEFPPVEKRGMWHSEIITDPYRPYTEYQNNDKV